PLQALLLMNEEEYLRAARHLAAAEIAIEGDDEARLERIYETITGRLPEARVSGALLSALADLRELYGANAGLAEELCSEAASGADAAELAAWTMVTSAVQNLDTTRTRD
ncbi:MAG: chromosome segregation protein, partial [Planctomycetota bacterium]|nr:chromosome segregation protein [Planctomycetota bacterium]